MDLAAAESTRNHPPLSPPSGKDERVAVAENKRRESPYHHRWALAAPAMLDPPTQARRPLPVQGSTSQAHSL